MSFSTVTISHKFTNADRTPASGTVEFSLTKRMTNGTETIAPSSVTATLNAEGKLSQVLTANNDPETVPTDSRWRVDLRLARAGQDSFEIIVPTGGGTVDLGSLLPRQPFGG